nr:NUDIX domain-containing protein [Paenibacillus sp. Marseille-Q4541]
MKKSSITVKAAVAVKNRQGELLLQQRADDGLWYIPLGIMKPGEALEDTAHRELWEETGLTAESVKLEALLSGPELKRTFSSGDEEYDLIGIYSAQGALSSEIDYDAVKEGPLRFFAQEDFPDLCPVTSMILSRL